MSRLKQKDTVLLVVDLQEKLFPVIEDREQVCAATVKLIEGCCLLDVPIIVTQQYSRGLGETIPSIREALRDAFSPIEKRVFSCADVPLFHTELAQTRRRQVVVCGIETHICVQQTALDLLADHEVFLACDCTASRRKLDRDTAIARMANAGVELMTTESILFELMETAEHPAFRQISQLVKG